MVAVDGTLTSRLAGFGTTIFAEMTALAMATGSINLGQGFPDTDGPREVLDAAVDAIRSGVNQYPPALGVPVLREAIAATSNASTASSYDPDTEVLVTAGATEALAGALLGLLDTGDEVVRVRADVRQLPGVHRPGRRRRRAGAAAARRRRRYQFDPDELRARDHAADAS